MSKTTPRRKPRDWSLRRIIRAQTRTLNGERSCIHPGMTAMSLKTEAKLVQRFAGGMLQPLDRVLDH
jgi:hypothetical protein